MAELDRKASPKIAVLFFLSILCVVGGISIMHSYSFAVGAVMIIVFVPITLFTYRLIPRKFNPELNEVSNAQISLLLYIFKHWKVTLIAWVLLGLLSAYMFSGREHA